MRAQYWSIVIVAALIGCCSYCAEREFRAWNVSVSEFYGELESWIITHARAREEVRDAAVVPYLVKHRVVLNANSHPPETYTWSFCRHGATWNWRSPLRILLR